MLKQLLFILTITSLLGCAVKNRTRTPANNSISPYNKMNIAKSISTIKNKYNINIEILDIHSQSEHIPPNDSQVNFFLHNFSMYAKINKYKKLNCPIPPKVTLITENGNLSHDGVNELTPDIIWAHAEPPAKISNEDSFYNVFVGHKSSKKILKDLRLLCHFMSSKKHILEHFKFYNITINRMNKEIPNLKDTLSFIEGFYNSLSAYTSKNDTPKLNKHIYIYNQPLLDPLKLEELPDGEIIAGHKSYNELTDFLINSL